MAPPPPITNLADVVMQAAVIDGDWPFYDLMIKRHALRHHLTYSKLLHAWDRIDAWRLDHAH